MLKKLGLRFENLRRYDQPQAPLFHTDPVSEIHQHLEAPFRSPDPAIAAMSDSERLNYFRELMDKGGQRAPIESRIITVEDGPVAGEWVCAEHSIPTHRILYLHGGAFTMGSPRSHRLLTSRLAQMTGACVFVPDYRLMPENSRKASIKDAQDAYRWICANGPQTQNAVENLVIAGDSAGGNLALMLLNWARDKKLRKADAAVALSPAVDSSLSSPSIRRNLATDAMLYGLMKPISQIPRPLLLLGMVAKMKLNPYHPLVSPIFADLHDLPPLLIQASNSETLEDDARRYANKARKAGSPVSLQVWSSLMHVWHAYEPELPEAKLAFQEIGRYLQTHAGLSYYDDAQVAA